METSPPLLPAAATSSVEALDEEDDEERESLEETARWAAWAVAQEERLERWSAALGLNAGSRVRVEAAVLTEHAESAVVERDVRRSLWRFEFSRGWSDAERDEQREALRRVLDRCFGELGEKKSKDGRGYHYYQGFHDVAEVCLAVAGFDEAVALGLVERMVQGHFADATRPDLARVSVALRLIVALVFAVDRRLGTAVFGAETVARDPVWALSWIITWFSHDVDDFDAVAKLWDDVLASKHAAFPLYVAAALVVAHRDELLADLGHPDDLGPFLYAKLAKLPRKSDLGAASAAAADLLERHPPTAVWARLPRLPRDLGRMLRPVLTECALANLYATDPKNKPLAALFVLGATCRSPLALAAFARRRLATQRKEDHPGVALLAPGSCDRAAPIFQRQSMRLPKVAVDIAPRSFGAQLRPVLFAALLAVFFGSDLLGADLLRGTLRLSRRG